MAVRHSYDINFIKLNRINSIKNNSNLNEKIENENKEESDIEVNQASNSSKKKYNELKPEFKFQKVENMKNDCYIRYISHNEYLQNEFLILDNNNSIKLYDLNLNK